MKRFLQFFLLILLFFIFVSCGDKSSSSSEAEEETKTVKIKAPTLNSAFAEGPLMLTSAGQSADVKMVESLIKKNELDYAIDVTLAPETFGNAKTLVIVIGGSSKGLGAAGIDAEDELERINSIIQTARDKNISIIGMHIGGKGRRGELSDRFISNVVPYLDYFVVVEGGDADGFLTSLATENNVPLETVLKIVDSYSALVKALI